MEISTTRFGKVEFRPDDVIHFPAGMLGLDGCTDWVLLADNQNDALGWLQSTRSENVALAIADPRRFVPDYQVRVAHGELALLALEHLQDARVVVIVSCGGPSITLNLKAPLVINLKRRIGCQVVNAMDHPVQYDPSRGAWELRKNVA